MTTYELPPEPADGRGGRTHHDRKTHMSKPQMPQMTPDQWESLATAVDALSSALAAVRPLAEWEMDLLSAATPEPDPWPTAPLIVWTVNGDRGLFQRRALDEYVATINGQVVEEGDGNTVSDPIPVRVVPVAEWEVLRKSVYGDGLTSTTFRKMCDLIDATDALGVQK